MELLHQPGDIIAERYRIIDTLGQGGSGTTYQAQDQKSGERVALKALSLRRMSDWKLMELFEREARILAQLEHPAIPRYLDYFCVDAPQDSCFYIAQQLAPGQSLAAWVMSSWRTDEGEVWRIAIQILEILIYLHSLTPPVIHRDIKPQNIIRRDDGQVFLVDFGAVADTYHNTFMRGSTVVGTYGYMAPEQFRGQAVPATDLYGLGATLLFLLTHRSPAELPTDRLKIDFRSRVQISSEFADWLEKMLQPDTEDRFSSAQEALAGLRTQRLIIRKSGLAVPWKAIVGVGVAAVAAVFVFNSRQCTLTGCPELTEAVYQAVMKGDSDTVRDYLERGGDANVTLNGRRTLLQMAIDFNRMDVAQLLIERGADVNFNEYGITPLLLAVVHHKTDLAEFLIDRGADINTKDSQGHTLLHMAVIGGWQDMVKLLIDKGAYIDALDDQDLTPLDWAFIGDTDIYYDRSGYLGMIARFSDNYIIQGNGALSFKGSPSSIKSMVELLIAKGADVNNKGRDKTGRTPLYLASESGLKETVQLLLAKGADVNAGDSWGNTPLEAASCARLSSKQIGELLLAKGADVNASGRRARTPLEAAVECDNKNMVELLLTKGAYVNAGTGSRFTVLHAASADGNKNMVELLLAKGADINAKSQKGKTPLHDAATNGSKEVVELLLAKGADINAKSQEGKTPLHEAAAAGRKDVVELLLAKGADVNSRDKNGYTPLHQATVAKITVGSNIDDRDIRDIVELLKLHGGTN